MEKSMKLIILVGFFASYLGAAPYIEYKNEAQFQYDNYIKNSNYFRAGYKFDNNMYLELGETQEVGYKFNRVNWTFKGKIEFKNENNNKLETEIRYTFR
jgi:hypothetical protein